LQKAPYPSDFTELGIISCDKFVQPENAYFPIIDTELGITICCKDEQPEKADPSIVVIELGITICCKDEQPENANSSIVVTELGITICLKDEHPEKALCPIDSTESGMTVFAHPAIIEFVAVSIIALQLFRESYMGLSGKTTIFSNLVQCEKELLPTFIIYFEITISCNDEQPVKAKSSIVVTESGMAICCKDEQPLKELLPIFVTESGITVFAHPAIIEFVAVSIIALQLFRES